MPHRTDQPPHWYTTAATAAHLEHCGPCRTREAANTAREDQHRAEYSQLLTRAHRHLGLRLATGDSDPDMDEALRRVREGRPGVAA